MPSGLQPTVTLTLSGSTVQASWPAIDGAAGYRVAVSDSAGVSLEVDVVDPAYEFTGEPGLTYTVAVTAFGPPSEPVQIEVDSALRVLTELQERLLATAVDEVYLLDEAALPGDQAAVRIALETALAATAGLSVTSGSGPELAESAEPALVLTGTSAALTGNPATAVTVVFTVAADFTLQATWTATPPEPWNLADAFPVLSGGPFEYVPTTAPKFAATTFEHTEPGFPFTLTPGLSFAAGTTVRDDLSTARSESGTALPTVVGGPLTVGPDLVPQFSWTSFSDLGPVTAAPVGQAPLVLTGGRLVLAYEPAPAGPATPEAEVPESDGGTGADGSSADQDPAETLSLTGRLPFGAATLDLPTPLAPLLTLHVDDPALDGTSLETMLAASGVGDVLGPLLPVTLLALADIRPGDWSMQFAPEGTVPTLTSVTLDAGTWTLAPGLAVEDIQLELTVLRSPGYARPEPELSYGGELRGTLQLGDGRYDVTAGIPPEGPWYLTVEDTGTVPTLAVLAGLTGLGEDDVIGVLPAPLLAFGRAFTLSRVGLLIDPDDQSLTEVAFTIAQTAPWPLVDSLLTVSDWAIDMVIARTEDSWATTGTLAGTVVLGSGDVRTAVAVTLAVPIGDGVQWTFALAEPVELPTVAQILELFGGDPTTLPVGLSSLGGLSLNLFKVSVDPAATTLQHVAFGFTQSGEWTVIPGELAVSDLSAVFSFLPDTDPIGVTGMLHGVLMLCESAVDVTVSKYEPDGDWRVSVADEDFVHVDAFRLLDTWLAGDDAAAALPDTLPLGNGFEIGGITLVFAGDGSGALKQFGFAAYVEDVWPLLDPYLAITDVTAQVLMPYPVVADQVTGKVGAVVAIGGTEIALMAEKPEDGPHWEFTGTLLQGATFDLEKAAAGLSDAIPVLPSDITAYGLPASVTITEASVRAVPDTGELHVAGGAEFDWEVALGTSTLAIRSIGGTLDVPAGGGPVAAALTGTLDYAGLHVKLALALGGPEARTVLTGVATAGTAADIDVPDLANGIGAADETETWDALVPADLGGLTFGEATAYLDLTGSRFMVYGKLAYGGGTAADGFVYLAPASALLPAVAPDPADDTDTDPDPGAGTDPGTAPDADADPGTAPDSDPGTDPDADPGADPDPGTGIEPWSYAVALHLGAEFRFASLLSVLAVVDDYIQVADARLVVCNLYGHPLSALSTATTPLMRSVSPTFTDPLADLAGKSIMLSEGALVSARIVFASGTLFAHILTIGNDQTPPEVWLSALIDKADPTNTTFAAWLPDITVLDTIVFSRVALSYSPGQADRFSLTGWMTLTGIFDGNYTFAVALTVDDTKLHSTAEQTSKAIANPFGIPGIELSGLGLRVDYTWATPAKPQSSSYGIHGHVLLGPEPAAGTPDARFSCNAGLDLLDGIPVLFQIVLDRDFSIGAFIAQCVTGSAAAWPSQFIEVTFARDTRITYYADDKDPHGVLGTAADGETPIPGGFTVVAKLALTLVETLELDGTINVQYDEDADEYTGVDAAVELREPLDLVFVELASRDNHVPGDPYTGGPRLSFATGAHPRFELSSGINFFGSPFVAFSVSVAEGSDGGTVFTGNLQAPDELKPFGVLEQSFTYTTHPEADSEFAIDGWPDFGWERELVKFVETIKSLADTSAESACGALAELVVNNAFKSNYEIATSVRVAGSKLVFGVTGTYTLTVLEALGGPFLEMEFPPLEVEVPSTTRWEDVPEVFAAEFLKGSKRFAQALLADPEKISMFLAMVVGPDALKVGAELACNALVDGVVAAAADAAVTAIVNAGGVLATGAVTAATTAISISLAGSGHHSGGGDGGGSDGGGGGGGGDDDGDGDGGGSGGGGSGGDTVTVAAPYLRKVSYAAGAVSGTWDAARGAAGYTFALVGPEGPDSHTVATHDYGLVITGELTLDPDPLPPGTYTAQVRGNRLDLHGPWATLPLVKPATPTPVLTYADGTLTATWTADLAAADTYLIAFLDPQGERVVPDQPLAGTARTAATALPDPVPGLYSAVLRADRTDQLPGAWSERPTLDIVALTAPEPGEVSRTEGTFRVTWTSPDDTPSDAAHEVRIVADGRTLATRSAPASPATLTADTEPLANGTQAQVRIRTVGTNTVSTWASSDFTIWFPPPPESVDIWERAGYIAVSWAGVALDDAPSAAFDLELLDGGIVVGSRYGEREAGAELTRTDGSEPQPGAMYTVRVRAVIGGNAGPWTESEPLEAATLAAPSDVRLAIEGTVLTASWTEPELPAPLTGPVRYYAALAQYGMEVGAVVDFTGTSTVLTRRDGRTPRPGETYSVHLMSMLPRHSSAWSESDPVVVLSNPVAVSASYTADTLTVRFDPPEPPSPSGASYEVEAAGNDTTRTVVPGSPVEIAMTGRPRGLYAVRVRARSAAADAAESASIGPWSAPVSVPVADPPTGLTLACDGLEIVASWTAVPEATGYVVTVRDPASANPVQTYQVGGGATTSARFSAAGRTRGVPCTVTVATECWAAVSAPSDAATVVVIDAPTDVRTTYDGTRITANWAAVNGATGYRVTLRGPSGSTAYTAEVTAATVQIPASGLARGMAHQLTVTALAAPTTAVDGTPVPVLLLDPPTGVSATVASGTITVRWDPVSYQASYAVELVDPSGRPAGNATAAQPPATLPGAGLTRGVAYTVSVRTQAGGSTSAASAPVSVMVPPDPPAGVTATYDGTAVTVRWAAAPGATGYQAVLRDQNGTVAGTQNSASPTASFPASALTRGVPYTATVIAQAGPTSSAPSAPASVTLLDPPGGLTASYAADIISASWLAAPGATSYRVTVTDPTGQVVRSVQTSSRSLPLPATGLARGGVHTVNVVSIAGPTTSRPSAPVAVTVVDPPTGLSASYSGSTLAITWNAAAGATGYDLDIRPVSPTSGPPLRTRTTAPNLPLSTSSLVSGGTYVLTVTTVTAAAPSLPSGPFQISLADPPAGVTAAYDGTQIQVNWSAAPSASSYRVTLRDSGGNTVLNVPVGTVTSTVLPATGLTRGAPYSVVVTTTIGAFTSRPSAPATVVLADPPPAPTLAFDGTIITATWPAVSGAAGYTAYLYAPSGALLVTQQVTSPATTFNASGLQRGIPHTVTVATRYGTTTSRPSPPTPITLVVDPPTGITASFDGTRINATWQPVQGATTYRAQIIDPFGRVVATPTSTTPSLTFAAVTPGVPYSIKVGSATYPAAPWSQAVPVTQNGYTLLCLGTSPGGTCGSGAPTENFTGVAARITRAQLDSSFMPTRVPNRTGWVGVLPGRTGHAAVLLQIVGALTTSGFLTSTEAFGVFTPPAPSRDTGAGGPLTCLCLGAPAGGNCGNSAPTDTFTGLFTGVTQADADARFRPTMTQPIRTGWVAVTNDPYAPLEVMLQLVKLLAFQGKFPMPPWDVFNKSMSVRINTDSGGTTTCLALGPP
ncbi:fibronectin type III domain-containing protein [Yinghuangia soli]|uniref:Fibronectin type-III domain-containing protein n=1 Tax=Yinghuangia soli TaxID=2908204 RepID=A0AA41TY81_9ACTN|nr:fibronectin type III domain-containing protein [Yinghuangia soli]MCF2525870.1 hypothetical protein [Yinghuangia soli]